MHLCPDDLEMLAGPREGWHDLATDAPVVPVSPWARPKARGVSVALARFAAYAGPRSTLAEALDSPAARDLDAEDLAPYVEAARAWFLGRHGRPLPDRHPAAPKAPKPARRRPSIAMRPWNPDSPTCAAYDAARGEGLTNRAIAARLGISEDYAVKLGKCLVKAGLAPRKSSGNISPPLQDRPDDPRHVAIKALRAAGATHPQVAARVGVSLATVTRVMRGRR